MCRCQTASNDTGIQWRTRAKRGREFVCCNSMLAGRPSADESGQEGVEVIRIVVELPIEFVPRPWRIIRGGQRALRLTGRPLPGGSVRTKDGVRSLDDGCHPIGTDGAQCFGREEGLVTGPVEVVLVETAVVHIRFESP